MRLLLLRFRERGDDVQIRYQNIRSVVDDEALVLKSCERARHHFPDSSDPGGQLVVGESELYSCPVICLRAMFPRFLEQQPRKSLTHFAKRESFDKRRASAKSRGEQFDRRKRKLRMFHRRLEHFLFFEKIKRRRFFRGGG